MRITGLASGLDMDQIVKDSMKPYRIKVDQTNQKKEILEIKQQLYRDVIKDSREFYNKYFDIANSDSLLLSKNWGTTSFESSDSGAVSVRGLGGAKTDNFKVSVTQLASKASTTLEAEYIKNAKSFTLEVGGEKVIIGNITDEELNDPEKLAERVNTKLSEKKIGVTVKYSEFSGGLVFESKNMGKGTDVNPNEFKITTLGKDGKITELLAMGKDSIATITNSRGEVKNVNGSLNKVLYDGVEFSFNDLTTNEVRITGKTDTKATADKIVAFVNDYNILMEKLSTITSEKRNNNYMPLTEEQKKEMSETEIKLWNEKTKQGQLNRDSDITRIASRMKGAMTSTLGSSLNPESIGINPVKDYGTKNGTFTVDIDKLTKALENNPEEVMNFFIATPQEGTPESKQGGKTGILQKLKTVIYEETVSVSSLLIKKVGVEGTASASTSQLTRNIAEYNKKMTYMEKDFARREQALYSKYAKLEVTLNKYNSQQSAMAQQFGAS